MSRIAPCLQALQAQGRKALIPYIVAGDPTPEFTVPMLHALVEAGADIIELGVPFSDPMAEGPVIQLAHERALKHEVRLSDVLAMVRSFRERDTRTPVVLMGYANPVAHMGFEKFAKAAAEAGVDGLLTVDMPPEEATDLTRALRASQIDSIFLIAPTTTRARIAKVAAMAGGYLYYVSLKGVTGAGHLDVESVRAKLAEIRAETALPVSVGFGIKDAASAKAIAAVADGVVVGSELVNRVLSAVAAHADPAAQRATAAAWIAELRKAID